MKTHFITGATLGGRTLRYRDFRGYKKYVLSNYSESVQCNFFIFDHVTFIQGGESTLDLVLCKFWGNSGVTASTSRHWKLQESSMWRWFHIASECHTGLRVALPGCGGGLGLGGRPCWLSISLCW